MYFQSSGSMFHIFGPQNETLSLPWYTDLTSGLENLEIYLKLYQGRLKLRGQLSLFSPLV